MDTTPNDLLVLLTVSRSAKFAIAAHTLGVNHTTISRRIAALEKALGGRVLSRSAEGWELTDLGAEAVRVAEQVESAVRGLGDSGQAPDSVTGVVRMTATDGFSAYVASPAVSKLRRTHSGLSVEIVTVTRRALQQRSGLDIEVVVGEPQVHRAEAFRLAEYELGMYASRDYLAANGTPATVDELIEHQLVYFVDSMLQVDDLDAPRRLVPGMKDGLTSTNVFVHVEATRAGAGIGFLPCFMADLHPDLVRLFPAELSERLPYWLVLRPDSLRRPAVAAVVQALREEAVAHQEALLGRGGTSGTTAEDQK
ncbi:LysR family transcriptional regulator [Brevibacterium sp. GP-SGM9]|uniref:LysR family transcriptional regulator n=1 Tax=unclassified Brevibacterium TaxID=2614124 RepID=UPI001E5692BB|nr:MULTISPECIES: LysR family transcriptional regulator [unclassified Brevibacterium]MCD1286421.1 LysR family transcriptional regulator [Brevibacterium sp. CCUG 69071]MDK8433790.1 LysR family transcriptional regulator [Brevibacterium sp. H-BE7]